MLSVAAIEGHPPTSAPESSRWRRLKRSCLRTFQSGLEATGLASLYVRLRNVAGTTILHFHSLADAEAEPRVDPRFHMKPDAFDRRMRFLSRSRNPVSLGRLVQALDEGRELPPRTVVVTFDDGYLDHLTVAAPILAKRRIPATFFVPTGCVSRGENPWVDRLHSAFRFRSRHRLVLEGEPPESFDLGRVDEERRAFRRLEGLLLTATGPERDAHLEGVEDQLRPEGKAPRLTMNWNDVRTLRGLSGDFEIGGHSRDHVDLGAVGEDVARAEISDCARDLRRELGDEPRDFSYPYERWTPTARDEVRRCGFRSAVGAGLDYLITRRSDRYALPRLDPVERHANLGFVTSGAFPGLSRGLTGRA